MGDELRKSLLKIACAALSLAAVPVRATPAEDAEHAVLKAINGSDVDRAALVKTGFSSNAFANESAADDERKWLDKLAKDSGGLTLVSSAPQGERMVEAIVRTNRDDKFGKLVLFASSKEPRKIADLF